MKYTKIEIILPSNLIREIQKYIQGERIYIPSQLKKRKKWGENSGSRIYIQNRNEEILNKYRSGDTIVDLSKKFYLLIDSIKKIIYKKY